MCVRVCVCARAGWDDEEDVGSIRNPLAEAKAGLLDGSGQQLPLQAVHVRCKLMDLLSQVRKDTLTQLFL